MASISKHFEKNSQKLSFPKSGLKIKPWCLFVFLNISYYMNYIGTNFQENSFSKSSVTVLQIHDLMGVANKIVSLIFVEIT